MSIYIAYCEGTKKDGTVDFQVAVSAETLTEAKRKTHKYFSDYISGNGMTTGLIHTLVCIPDDGDSVVITASDKADPFFPNYEDSCGILKYNRDAYDRKISVRSLIATA